MEWDEKEIKQCVKPEGELGIDVGKEMNVSHEELWRWGLNFINKNGKQSILDVGCGGGKAINLMSSIFPKSSLVGIDYSKEMVDLARQVNDELIKQERVEIMNGSVSSLPMDDNKFDLVTAFETYYFWPDLINNLKEIKRTLKPGGVLLMVNETYKHKNFEERNAKIIDILDITIHTPSEYKIFLDKSGFSNIEIKELEDKNWLTAIAYK